MKDAPIIFAGPMVRAILEGRKTQTRRIIKVVWESAALASELQESYEIEGRLFGGPERWTVTEKAPRFAPGQLLWVRENFQPKVDGGALYHATDQRSALKWKPSIHMPRSLSRITLEVEAVKVERLQDIWTIDAQAEGIPQYCHEARKLGLPVGHDPDSHFWDNRTTIENFALVWDSIHGKGAWDANPWVTAITFKPILKNIDAHADQT